MRRSARGKHAVVRRRRDARDRHILDRTAAELNREAADVLAYQTD